MSKHSKSSGAVLDSPVQDEASLESKDLAIDRQKFAEYAAQIAAANKTQARLEYDMEGTILDANEKLLAIAGYTLDEIRGKHVDIFVDEAARRDPEYKAASRKLWNKLAQAEPSLSKPNASPKRAKRSGFVARITPC